MGADSRRGESASLAEAIARFRTLRWIAAPGTLEGGDVVRIGSTLFVGRSARSNDAGIAQLAGELAPLGYAVQAVEMRGCLHLKSACTYLERDTVLANRDWADLAPFARARVIDVAPGETAAADVLASHSAVSRLPLGFPACPPMQDRPRVRGPRARMLPETGRRGLASAPLAPRLCPPPECAGILHKPPTPSGPISPPDGWHRPSCPQFSRSPGSPHELASGSHRRRVCRTAARLPLRRRKIQ